MDEETTTVEALYASALTQVRSRSVETAGSIDWVTRRTAQVEERILIELHEAGVDEPPVATILGYYCRRLLRRSEARPD